MTNFFFWFVWTAVSAIGVKYSTNILLEREITFTSSILIMLVYQWIRFIKLPEKKVEKKVERVQAKLPPPRINKKRHR